MRSDFGSQVDIAKDSCLGMPAVSWLKHVKGEADLRDFWWENIEYRCNDSPPCTPRGLHYSKPFCRFAPFTCRCLMQDEIAAEKKHCDTFKTVGGNGLLQQRIFSQILSKIQIDEEVPYYVALPGST